MSSLEERYDVYRNKLDRVDQGHLLTFWPELDDGQRQELLDDLDQIDFARCAELIPVYVVQKPQIAVPDNIAPPEILPAEAGGHVAELYARATEAGRDAIAAGKVAAFTVAGGQGTRLGFDGPKGAFPISPIRNATLFRLFAESLLGIERRFGHRPRWYIMTSPLNDAETRQFFAENNHFGLSPVNVTFFPQGQMPAFLPDGRIAMSDRHRIALSPDGHGGSLDALARSGALADMQSHGIELISYFQVDNPLVKTIDPLFLGLHLVKNSEMSSKAVRKAGDTEKVGNFCVADGKLTIIEYSDLPDELAHARNPDGSRQFDAGNVAIHVLSREFVERLTAPGSSLHLPWHRAEKKVPVIDAAGRRLEPDTPNVVKLEMFVFDAIPMARNPIVAYTTRAEEFSPVKNAEGTDSPATARRDMVRRAACWLEACGTTIPRSADGEPATAIEITPAYAVDEGDLCERLPSAPRLAADQPFLLE